MMAGRGDREAFRSVGGLELKGLPDPVQAYEVAWVPLGVELALISGEPGIGKTRLASHVAVAAHADGDGAVERAAEALPTAPLGV